MNNDNKPSIWWQRANWFFLILMVLPGFLPQRANLDFATGRRVAAFRIAAIFLGFVGWTATALIKRIMYPPARKKKNLANAAPTRLVMPLPDGAVVSPEQFAPDAANPWDSVARDAQQKRAASIPTIDEDVPRLRLPYRTEASGFWRIDPWSLLRHGATQFAAFGFPVVISLFVSRFIWRLGWTGVAETTGAVFAAWWLFVAVFALVEYKKHFPTKNTVRHCEVILTPLGFYDARPDKAAFVRWSAVSQVRQYQDCIYIYSPAAQQSFPIDGFDTESDAHTFFDAAQTLWKSRGQTIPPALVAPSSPPALAFDL